MKTTGRPKGPETDLFRVRVRRPHLEGIKRFFKDRYGYEQPDDYWEKAWDGAGLPVSSPITPIQPSKDIQALLDDVERLEREKKALEDKVQRVARLTDNEKLILWIRKYDQLKKEYDEVKGRMDGLEY